MIKNTSFSYRRQMVRSSACDPTEILAITCGRWDGSLARMFYRWFAI